MQNLLVIRSDGKNTFEKKSFPSDKAIYLDEFEEIVGGSIEVRELPRLSRKIKFPVFMVTDEEGLFKDVKLNKPATALFRKFCGISQVFGDVSLCTTDNEKVTRGFSDDQWRALLSVLMFYI